MGLEPGVTRRVVGSTEDMHPCRGGPSRREPVSELEGVHAARENHHRA